MSAPSCPIVGSEYSATGSTPAPVFRLMPHQRPLFLVPFGLVEPFERINKPAVPERGDAVFRVQVFPIRAVHHEKRMIDCREMDKKDCGSGERSYSKRSGKESRFLGGMSVWRRVRSSTCQSSEYGAPRIQ